MAIFRYAGRFNAYLLVVSHNDKLINQASLAIKLAIKLAINQSSQL
jgi:hypothetical protein